MADFEGIRAEVDRLETVVASAVALINGIADQIAAAVAANDAGDNTELAGLSDSLRGQADTLATAVAAHTAAEDEEPGEAEAMRDGVLLGDEEQP